MENRKLIKLDLNVTNKCNFRCVHCAFDSGIVKMKELSIKKIEQILKETKELGGKKFDITGGEPLIRKDIDKIIKTGKKLDYKIELVTNGSLLTKEKLLKFKKLGLDAIAISVDGSKPKIYNRIRRKDNRTFFNLIEKIKLIKKMGFYLKLNTTVFKCNLKDIPNIIKLGVKLKVDEIGLYYFTPIGRGKKSKKLVVEPIRWLEFIRNKLKKYENKKIKISLEYPFIEKRFWNINMSCIACKEQSHLQILADGNVYPCAILASYNKPIANLNNCSVKDIWKNKELWRNYWKSVSYLFKKNKGSCFCIKNIDNKKYRFVCPLRKFDIDEVK
jgi:mycofactocin biosynthetic radical S-adenosylmethionine protein MftC